MVVTGRRAVPWVAATIALAALSCRCSRDVEQHAEADAADAEVETAFDSTPLGIDGDTRPVMVEDSTPPPSVDAGPPPFPGTWVNIPGLPECPTLWVSKDPATDVADTWSACPSGRPGCERMATAWSTERGEKIQIPRFGRRGSNGEFVAYERVYPRPPGLLGFDWLVHVVQSPKNVPQLAIAVDNRGGPAGKCVGRVFPSPDLLPFLVNVPGLAPAIKHYSLFKYGSPSAPVDQFKLANAAFVPPPGFFNQLGVGDRRIFFGTRGPTSIAVVDIATHAVVYKVGSGSAPVELPFIVRKGAIAGWSGSPQGIAFVDDYGKVAKIHELTPPRELRALQVDPSSDAVVWVDGEYSLNDAGAPWLSGFVLWTAPFATTAADFKPRRVTRFDSDAYRMLRGTVIAHRGYALLSISDLEMRLVRLSDGQGWTLSADPDDRWVWPAYVDDEEVRIVIDNRLPGGSPQMKTFVRLKIASLGPPNVPPT